MATVLINRPKYIAELSKWKDQTDLLKIITDVRRCGQSKLCDLFQQNLKKEHAVILGKII